ncbi:hypothetical protein ES703_107641 [subsurface metagenome]
MVRLTLEWSDIYAYTLSNVDIFAPLSAGVYKLSSLVASRHQMFYVSQAENLNKELRGHLSAMEPNTCIRSNFWYYTCYFQFAIVASRLDRDCAERALYDHYKTPCNTVPPHGEPCDINFD